MSMSRWRAIAGHELTTQLTGPLFWVLLVVLVLVVGSVNPVAMLPGGASTVAGVRAFDNSAHALAPTFAIGAFFAYPFFACVMAGLCVIRDDELAISEMLHSTALTRGEYVIGKLSGVLGALSIAIVAHLIIMVAYREVPALVGGSTTHGPFVAASYVVPVLLLVAPLVMVLAVLSFAVGAVWRRPLAVYAVPVLLFVSTVMFTWNWAPGWLPQWLDNALIVLDPTGLRWVRRALFAVDRGIPFYNVAPLQTDVLFWAGRIVALGVSLLVTVGLSRFGTRYAFASDGAVKTPAVTSAAVSPHTPTTRHARTATGMGQFDSLTPLRMTSRVPQLFAGAHAVFRTELRLMLKQPSLWVFAVFLSFVVVEVGVTGDDLYGAPVLLTAGTLAVRAIPVVTLLVCAYLLFTVVELMHRDVITGFEAIAHSSPISTEALLLGRGASVGLQVAFLMAACMSASLMLLLLQPEAPVEVWPLVLIFGVVLAPTFALWATFMMTVMTIVRHRTAGLGVGILTLLCTGMLFMTGQMTWLSNWPLWGALRWTDMGVFPLNGEALLWNRMGALALAALLVAIMQRTYRRVDPDAVASASRRTLRYYARQSVRLLPFAVAPLVVAVFLATNIDQGWQGQAARDSAQAYHARNAVAWAHAPLATIRNLRVEAAIAPNARNATVSGVYTMINETSSSLTQLPFTVHAANSPVRWTLNGNSVLSDDRSGLHILDIGRSLAPGDSLAVGFGYTLVAPRGMSRNGGGAGTFITSAGALLSTRGEAFLPVPGFLDTQTDGPAVPGTVSGFNNGHTFSARVSIRVPEAFTATAVGILSSDHVDNGYRTMVWVTPEPVAELNVIAGQWNVRARNGNAVYFHANHVRNVNVMLNTLEAARVHYTEWFGPYVWGELRISEFPDFETNATAFPSNISFSEGIGFLTGGPPAKGLAFSVVAHEVAHQWFGHMVRAGHGPGTGLLVEGLANYATLLLQQSVNGDVGRQAFAKQLELNYIANRYAPTERALLATDEGERQGEAVLAFRGALTLWMLREHIGAERMEQAVRAYADAQRTRQRAAEVSDFIGALRNHAPDTSRFDAFVAQWMSGTALPEFEIRTATVSQHTDEWTSAVVVRNVGTGDALVDIAVVSANWDNETTDRVTAANGTPLRQHERVFLRAGDTAAVSIRTPFAPTQIIVDPDLQVLQLNRERARTTVRTSLN